MKKYVIALVIGILMTLFAVLAGLGGGAYHCATPERVLFPYVSLLGINAEWGILGNLLFGL
ncbi:MAG: hypothetical protein EHM89_05960 [Acidobacteria bacterium]|nr:MAG: hypothetical protein EHM89_05960 [Acidobacteriota bacterium]